MLTSLLSATNAVPTAETQGSTTFQSLTSVRSQLRGSAAVFVAASLGCDVSSMPIAIPTVSAASTDTSSIATSMSCSPPRTYTRTSNSTRLIVPVAALPSKTRRKRGRRGISGGGGDDGGDNFFFGGDDGFGGNGGGDDFGDNGEGSSDGDHIRRWLQDALLLWSVFCAWSTWNVFQYITKQKTAAVVSLPSTAFAAMSLHMPAEQCMPTAATAVTVA